jgi:hypothetical protein
MQVLKEQRAPALPKHEVERTVYARLPGLTDQALVLTGVRRCGKSTLQTQLMRRYPAAFYLNLEDTRLFGLSPEDFPTLLDAISEIVPADAAIFLDEVQEVPEWQRFVRALLDHGRPVCLTGSNASLLGRELGAKLTGRHLSYEVFPFSYPEYLAFTGQRPGAGSLRRFLDDGGFPSYLRDRRPLVLQELLRDIVERDVAQRHRLRESRHVMNLLLFLLANSGQPVSLQRLTKSLAIPTVGQTSRYLGYLQDAYLLFAVPKFSQSFKQRVVAPNKYYAVDNGLRRANVAHFAPPDVGHRLENAVFLALHQQESSVCYAGEKDLWECDFLTEDTAIQVCAELTTANRQREIGGLAHACQLRGKRQALLLTLDQRDRIDEQGIDVVVRPAWEWLSAATAGLSSIK